MRANELLFQTIRTMKSMHDTYKESKKLYNLLRILWLTATEAAQDAEL